MNIEMVELARLKPYSENPRINDAAVDAVAASIKAFGVRQPLVVDEQDVIIVGHTRYKAAQKLGLANRAGPCRSRSDSRAGPGLPHRRQPDRHPLPVGRRQAAPRTDRTAAGRLRPVPDRLLGRGVGAARWPRAPSEGLCDPDEVPDPPAEPITQARRPVATGPTPVALRRRHQARGPGPADGWPGRRPAPDRPALQRRPTRARPPKPSPSPTTRWTPQPTDAFLAAALTAAGKHLKPGGSFYLWHADTAGLDVRSACADAGLSVRQCLVWVKSVLVPGRQDYQWKHEPCLYGWADGRSPHLALRPSPDHRPGVRQAGPEHRPPHDEAGRAVRLPDRQLLQAGRDGARSFCGHREPRWSRPSRPAVPPTSSNSTHVTPM